MARTKRTLGQKIIKLLPRLLLLAFLLGVIVPLMYRAACVEPKKQISLDEAYGKKRPLEDEAKKNDAPPPSKAP